MFDIRESWEPPLVSHVTLTRVFIVPASSRGNVVRCGANDNQCGMSKVSLLFFKRGEMSEPRSSSVDASYEVDSFREVPTGVAFTTVTGLAPSLLPLSQRC